jgi:hypothetical protein
MLDRRIPQPGQDADGVAFYSTAMDWMSNAMPARCVPTRRLSRRRSEGDQRPGTLSGTNDFQCPSACTISSVIFFASPNSIIVFGRKNSSLSTPAYPDAIERLTNSTVAAFSTSRIGIP